MKNTNLFTLIMLVSTCAFAQTKRVVAASPREVIAVEKAFAKMALDKNMKEAFTANMNDSSLLESGGKLVRGLPIYRQLKPDTTGKLIWAPTFASISLAGDMGYTTGPYKFSTGGKDVAFGDFATVWQKQANGQWKFIIDLGCGHQQPVIAVVNEAMVTPAIKTVKTGSLNTMLAAETALNTIFFKGDKPGQRVHPLAHILHDEQFVVIDKYASAYLVAQNKFIKYRPSGYKLANSKDFGVVYGYCEKTTASAIKKSVYMHVWRLAANGNWQLLHETIKDIDNA